MNPEIVELTLAQVAPARVTNWIGTIGRGRYGIDARPVKTIAQAKAWCRKLAVEYPSAKWAVFPVEDYQRKPLGFGACEIEACALEELRGTR
jgi:hypothetical protein